MTAPHSPTLPLATDPADWPSVHALPLEAWRPALEALAGRLGLPDAWERLPGGEDSAVFATGEHVVKLVPPCNAADAVAEAAVLPRLRLPVATPRLRASLSLDGWTVLHVDRLPGVPADLAWDGLHDGARREVMRALGGVLASLRRTPLVPADGDALALLDRLRARARRHEAAGFPDVDGFLDRHLSPASAALVHFDLNTGNVMLDADGRVAGVLDFVASRAFFPVFDLVTPGVFFARGDPGLLDALVGASGLGEPAPEELAAWHLLHPFSDLRRDLGMAGRSSDGPLAPAVIDLWRR